MTRERTAPKQSLPVKFRPRGSTWYVVTDANVHHPSAPGMVGIGINGIGVVYLRRSRARTLADHLRTAADDYGHAPTGSEGDA